MSVLSVAIFRANRSSGIVWEPVFTAVYLGLSAYHYKSLSNKFVLVFNKSSQFVASIENQVLQVLLPRKASTLLCDVSILSCDDLYFLAECVTYIDIERIYQGCSLCIFNLMVVSIVCNISESAISQFITFYVYVETIEK